MFVSAVSEATRPNFAVLPYTARVLYCFAYLSIALCDLCIRPVCFHRHLRCSATFVAYMHVPLWCRRVTVNMDERFPDATAEDLERSDNICIICREEMTASSRNKKLSCSHVFHLHCLRCCSSMLSRKSLLRASVMPAFHLSAWP